jgi:hypothetical protein
MDQVVARMNLSESLVQDLQRGNRLRPLKTALANLETWPSDLGRPLFADEVRVQAFDWEPTESEQINQGAGQRWQYAPSVNEESISVQDLSLLEPLLERFAWLDQPKVKIHLPVPRWLDPVGQRSWQCTLQLSGHGEFQDGRTGYFAAWFECDWRLPEAEDLDAPVTEQDWRMERIAAVKLELTANARPLFAEVLDEVIPNADSLEKARQSLHEEMVVEFLTKGRKWPKPYLSWRPSAGEVHPTCTVVDIDRDGWDDFYVQERSGRNLFFRNQQDGTFIEEAAERGLDFDGNTCSALFVDLDNDGDEDAVIGGTLERTRLLENIDGVFHDRAGTWAAEEDLPFLVSSLNAIDYDNDGLLDIYVSTYGANFVNFSISAIRKPSKRNQGADQHLLNYLPQDDFDYLYTQMEQRAVDMRVDTNRPGPPNVLLHNLGNGRFEVAEGADVLRIFYNCYQSTWSDVDQDGDLDVYCANDFAPNFFFRNEGDGNFVDATEELQLADIGFGMGVSFGDFDNDGRQDLYVTNMFSKAARRVVSFFIEGGVNYDPGLIAPGEGMNPVYRRLGEGNSLFRNTGNQEPWDKISGLEPPDMTVENGSWGWGAQFADFDNDGWLDIYAPDGFYTAPKEAALDVDV